MENKLLIAILWTILSIGLNSFCFYQYALWRFGKKYWMHPRSACAFWVGSWFWVMMGLMMLYDNL